MNEWVQPGFALISDIYPPGGERMPMVHAFSLGRWDADLQHKVAMLLPEHLRIDLRVVAAKLHLSDEAA